MLTILNPLRASSVIELYDYLAKIIFSGWQSSGVTGVPIVKALKTLKISRRSR